LAVIFDSGVEIPTILGHVMNQIRSVFYRHRCGFVNARGKRWDWLMRHEVSVIVKLYKFATESTRVGNRGLNYVKDGIV
jgi:hypothetical protein